MNAKLVLREFPTASASTMRFQIGQSFEDPEMSYTRGAPRRFRLFGHGSTLKAAKAMAARKIPMTEIDASIQETI
jgi:hypothetical protein